MIPMIYFPEDFIHVSCVSSSAQRVSPQICGDENPIAWELRSLAGDLPFGKRLHNYGKSPFPMGKHWLILYLVGGDWNMTFMFPIFF